MTGSVAPSASLAPPASAHERVERHLDVALQELEALGVRATAFCRGDHVVATLALEVEA